MDKLKLQEIQAAGYDCLCENYECWQNFLKTAGHLYKLNFSEQVLIYGQRQNLTAILPMKQWNTNFGRWINKGANCVYSLGKSGNLIRLFDISDTHEGRYRRNFQKVPIWQLTDENRSIIINKTVVSHINVLNKESDSETVILNNVAEMVRSSLLEYTQAIEKTVQGSGLEALSLGERQQLYEDILNRSVAYGVLLRCGFAADEIIFPRDMKDITYFNTKDSLTALGNGVNSLTKAYLRAITKTIKEQERGMSNDRTDNDRTDNERTDNERTSRLEGGFEPTGHVGYAGVSQTTEPTSGDKSMGTSPTSGTAMAGQGGEVWENDGLLRGNARRNLGDERYLGEIPHHPQTHGLGEHQFLGRTEGAISQEELSQDLRSDGEIRVSSGVSGELRPNGGGIVSNDDRPREQTGRSNQKTASRGLVGIRTESIHSGLGGEILYNEGGSVAAANGGNNGYSQLGADSVDGNRLPTPEGGLFRWRGNGLENPQTNMQADENTSSAFSFALPQNIIDAVLCSGNNHQSGLLNIVANYQKQKVTEENIKFLKKEFKGGKGLILNGEKISCLYADEGILIAYGDRTEQNSPQLVEWKQVDNRIKELLALGRFVDQAIITKVPEFETEELAKTICFMYMEKSDNVEIMPYLESFLENNNGFSYEERTERIVEKLNNRAEREIIIAEIATVAEEYTTNKKIFRWKQDPESLLKELKYFAGNQLIFSGENYVAAKVDYFITEDEINEELINHCSKYEIQKIFNQNTKITESDLRKIYGWTGHGNCECDAIYSNQGLQYTKNVNGTKLEVAIKWNRIAKRFNELLENGEFLKGKQIEKFKEYLEIENQRNQRNQVANQYKALIDEFIDNKQQLGEVGGTINRYELNMALRDFVVGEQKTFAISVDGDLILPILEQGLNIISQTPAFTANAEVLKGLLKVDMGKVAAPQEKVTIIKYSDFASDFIKLAPDFIDIEKKMFTNVMGKEFVFGLRQVPNGVVIWNYLEIVNNDYKIVARLNDDGGVAWLDEEIPLLAKNFIAEISPQTYKSKNSLVQQEPQETSVVVEPNIEPIVEPNIIEKTQSEDESKLSCQIIGNTPFKFIKGKKYRKMDTAVALKVVAQIEQAGIKYSGKIVDAKTTLTIPANDIATVDGFIKTSQNEIEPVIEIAVKQKPDKKLSNNLTIEEKNYLALTKMAPEFFNNEACTYLKMSAGSAYMPLSIEWIGADRIAISHSYSLNGDLMADPDMEFKVDLQQKTLSARTFQQDDLGLYQTVENDNDGIANKKLAIELNQFAQQWFKNCLAYGYEKAKMNVNYQDEELEIFYNDKQEIVDIKGSEPLISNYIAENNLTIAKISEVVQQEPQETSVVVEPIVGPSIIEETQSIISATEEKTVKQKVEQLSLESFMETYKNPEEVIFDPNSILKKVVIYEGREFVIDSYNNLFNEYSLLDIAMYKSGYPITRAVSVDLAVSLVEQSLVKAEGDEIDLVLQNYKISDSEIDYGNPKTKFSNNLAAIKLLKALEENNKLANEDEQKVLGKYLGWGGLADAFDASKSAWSEEYEDLKALLTADEYNAARKSTLTAYYTPPSVIKGIYQGLENLGFTRGNILEPSCGIGNFMGMLPETMKKAKFTAVELDSLSGRIAKQLYQNADIKIQGFETVKMPSSSFDVAVGNVPFGQLTIKDKEYGNRNLLIHDYFFTKTIDKVKPHGVIALITSKGTMDKKTSLTRQYIAERAELIGAIRLPENTFENIAGTVVTSDILFLRKREKAIEVTEKWTQLDTTSEGIEMNSYFIEHPEMVVGKMVLRNGKFGAETACVAVEGLDQEKQFLEAINEITANAKIDFPVVSKNPIAEKENKLVKTIPIPTEITVRPYSYVVVDGELYYRDGEASLKQVSEKLSAVGRERIKGLIPIRDCIRRLLYYQTENYEDEYIKKEQSTLNVLYDNYIAKFDYITNRANRLAFREDSTYPLLAALENFDDNGGYLGKADMFTKRTIKPHIPIVSCDNPVDALSVSIAETAGVDMAYMSALTNMAEKEIYQALEGIIFLNPLYDEINSLEQQYLISDEYLSGNVREKLRIATLAAEANQAYNINVEKLKNVQPKDLTASEIEIGLGATWLPESDIDNFIYELLKTDTYTKKSIKTHYAKITGNWNIDNKNSDFANLYATSTYGTTRINAYKIIEETLNKRDVKIWDKILDDEGKEKRVVNEKETIIAQSKQDIIKEKFKQWIWQDPDRRIRLCQMYNERFNSVQPREYNGSHLEFAGINPQIKLKTHQCNAIAHAMYGGNTLLAHSVGAGKTFEMVAIAQESKRLGLCNKSMVVVPNHLIEQWSAEYMQLYPAANILVARKEDFTKENRCKFCGRIATGNYDAVIIGHSQFEKIPMSEESQIEFLENQVDELMAGIAELKQQRGEKWSIKQLELTRDNLVAKIEFLSNQEKKDDVVTFEELGIDKLIIDESHFYKNLFLYTKMRNVAGVANAEAKKSSDLFAKCRYMDKLTGGRGIVFATGTPISNSMSELYTIQRYLQYDTLRAMGLEHFDSWASNFGETITSLEITPEGKGFRAKTRFARFYNLPELMNSFKEIADIKTADQLDLEVPNVNEHNVVLKPSQEQLEYVENLCERSQKIHAGIDPSVDNMLCVTNDGRKAALDMRLINPLLPDNPNGKTTICAKNVFEIYEKNQENNGTQMVFCDMSTPKKGNDENFNVYDDIKTKLVAMGIPAEEIAYIHNAKSDLQKKELFGKVNGGKVRVILGSTVKMGAGTNAQKRLVALHHLDCPWRPADLSQREGRIVRQGNRNKEVDIYTYVTEQTFDAYSYQTIVNKQKFISQIMTSKSPLRSMEDIGEQVLRYEEIKALTSGNPLVKEKLDLDNAVKKLKLLEGSYLSQKYILEDKIRQNLPTNITLLEKAIVGHKADEQWLKNHTQLIDGFSPMTIQDKVYMDKKQAGEALLNLCKTFKPMDRDNFVGEYRGFKMKLNFYYVDEEFKITLENQQKHTVALGKDIFGNITRLDNALADITEKVHSCEEQLTIFKQRLEAAKKEVEKPFAKAAELQQKMKRLIEVNKILTSNKTLDNTDRNYAETGQLKDQEPQGMEMDL